MEHKKIAQGTQEKVVAEIRKIAKAAKVDADFEWGFSNVGHVYFRRGFETVANAHLDFQQSGGYLTAAVNKGANKAAYFGKPDSLHYVKYENATDFVNFFFALKRVVRGGK